MNDINKMFHSALKTPYNKKALPIGKTSNGLIILNLWMLFTFTTQHLEKTITSCGFKVYVIHSFSKIDRSTTK